MTTLNKEIDKNEETPFFSTRDLALAATLVTLKFPMIGIDYQIIGSNKDPIGYFKFEDSVSVKEACRKFTQSLLAVEPKLFMTNVHFLKAEVVNAVTSPHSQIFR